VGRLFYAVISATDSVGSLVRSFNGLCVSVSGLFLASAITITDTPYLLGEPYHAIFRKRRDGVQDLVLVRLVLVVCFLTVKSTF
jgi:hypothetical protein